MIMIDRYDALREYKARLCAYFTVTAYLKARPETV